MLTKNIYHPLRLIGDEAAWNGGLVPLCVTNFSLRTVSLIFRATGSRRATMERTRVAIGCRLLRDKRRLQPAGSPGTITAPPAQSRRSKCACEVRLGLSVATLQQTWRIQPSIREGPTVLREQGTAVGRVRLPAATQGSYSGRLPASRLIESSVAIITTVSRASLLDTPNPRQSPTEIPA